MIGQMAYQIDQSGKIEDTARPTIVAFSNSKSGSIKISSSEKRHLLSAIKALEYPKQNYIYKIFATLIFILIRASRVQYLQIDIEYPGHNSVIKDTLIHLYGKYELQLPEIEFKLVGKKSP